MGRTTISVDDETWRAFEVLVKETGLPKGKVARLAVKHLAECEDTRRAFGLLGYDVEAIVKAVSEMHDSMVESVILSA